MPIQSINPATAEILHTYEELSAEVVESKIQAAHDAFKPWRQVSFEHRATLMKAAAAHIRANKDTYARTMTLEMGKPITESLAEMEKCALVCDYYAENAAEFLKDSPRESDAGRSYVRFAPLGVVLAVMPWNFPFWQVFRFAAPALMAGNVGLLKHSSNVPQCSLAIEAIFRESGFPEGVFQALLIGSKRVDDLIAHPHVQAVTLTGSNAAGEQVAETAGRNIKKTVLELGGSDPFIVLEDADLDLCATQAARGRLINGGQSCIAAKRFIVMESIADAFEQKMKEKMEAVVVGDPLDSATQVGPLAREDLVVDLDAQVQKSIAQGAHLLTGGKRLDRPGYFYAPTLLSGVKKGMPVYDEETFGPVAPVVRVVSVEEAITVANDTVYGLGGSVWGRDAARAEQVALQIEAGAVFVNGIVKSDPRLPFGGIKKSGYGRELSDFGIREFVNVQTVWVNLNREKASEETDRIQEKFKLKASTQKILKDTEYGLQ